MLCLFPRPTGRTGAADVVGGGGDLIDSSLLDATDSSVLSRRCC